MMIRFISSEQRERELQEAQRKLNQSFQDGYSRAFCDISRALAPVIASLDGYASSDILRRGTLVIAHIYFSPDALAEHLGRAITYLLQIAEKHAELEANVDTVRKERLALQRQAKAVTAEADRLREQQSELDDTEQEIATLKSANGRLHQDVNQLEDEIRRQHAVIVELNERLKPTRTPPQKQKSG